MIPSNTEFQPSDSIKDCQHLPRGAQQVTVLVLWHCSFH